MKKFDSLKTFSQHVKVLAVMLFACLFSLGANAQVYQYQLVSENQTDWSGTYLLAYTTSSSTVVLSGITSNNPTAANPVYFGDKLDVTSFSLGNMIASNATTDACAVTIAPVTDSTYTLYLKDVGYLGWSSGNSLISAATASTNVYQWKLTMTDGVLSIINMKDNTRKLQYNSSAACFRAYTSNQKACSLYKYEELTGIPAPTFSVNTGTFYAPQTVTITSNVPGTTIYYTVDGTNPTVSSTQYSEPIAINATTTLKAIAVLGETASNVGTAVYTFPTFTTLDNLAAFKAQTSAAAEDIFKVNSTMTVIFQTTDKYHTFLQDSSAAIYVYGTMDKAYQPGDVISGGVFGTYSLYKQMNEMKPVSGAPLAAGVHGTAVAPIKVKLADLINNYSQYEGMLVTVEGVQVSSDFTFSTSRSTGVNVSQGENTIQIYNTFKTLDKSLIANSLVNVTGLVIRYNTTVEIAPRSNNDISVPMPSLPYMVDFDENVDTLITLVNGDATNKWYVGQAEGFDNNKLFISSTNGVTNKYDVTKTANVQVYRDVFIPENGATLSFDVRVNGEAGNDMLRVVLYNYTNNILNFTSNWSVGIYDEPEWTNVKTVISPEHAGMARLVFYWVNNNNSGEQFPAAIDNISLTEAVCAQPIALNPVVSHDTAVITWNTVDTTQNSWIFEYKLEDHNEWYSINTTTPNITLTGLQGSSNYDVRVKANCGTESSEWTVGQFEVGCLHKGVVQGDTTLTIGTGTSTTNQWLFPGYDGWQYVAELYEMPKAGILNDIAFYLSSNATNSSATMKVWVKAVDANYTLASSNTFNSMLQGATQIFDGNANFTSTGWIHFPIDNGLNMPEGKKLLVLVRGTGCSTSGGCSRYHRYSTASNMVWYKRQDSSDPGQNVSGSLSSNRANIQMTMKIEKTVCNDQLACVAPTAVTVTDITENSAVITWSGNATDYAFEYKTGENDWTVVSVSDTTYTITGLTQKTDYLVRVKAICGENNYSLYSVEVPFTTTSVCPVVSNITSSNLSTTTTLSWTPGGEENDWNIRFRPMGTTEWVDLPRISGIASTTFGGLNDQTDYEVEIKALCDLENEDNQSSWAHYVFTSGCAPFELTYEEGFNAVTRPECWDDNDITFNGTAAVAESAAQWLMTPPIQIPADYNTYVVVDMQGEATLMASYRGTAMDRFTEIAVLANDSTGHYIVEVPAAYKNKAVNFMFLTNDEFSIDNVLFTQCAFVPTDFVAANPLNNSVELSWTGLNNNGWILEYAKAGSENWTALTLEQTSDTVNYTLTGLEGDQLYKFRVSTICEGGSISKPSNVATIQTRCDAVAVPYKDFTRSQYGSYYTGTLHCWTPFYTGRDSQSGASVSSGQLLLKKYYHVTDAPSGDVFAILPTMDTALNTLQISFNIKTNNGTPNQKVYLCLVTDVNNPADSFKILKDYTATSNEESYFYTLDGVEREGNLAFRMPLEDAHSHEVLINNVVVEVIPPCQAPFNLAANALDENRVQLTWEYVADEGGDNDFTIRYKKMTSPTDFPDPYEGGTEKLGASTPREFNDLEYGATYRFVIRHECGDMHSVWSKEYDYTFVKNYNIAKETNITTCHGTVVYQDTTTAATTKTMVINPSNTTSWVKLTGDVQLDGCTLYVYEGNAVAANKLLKTYTGDVNGIALTPLCENEITLRLVKKANSNPVLNLQIECEAAPTCSAPSKPVFDFVNNVPTLTWEAGCWGNPQSYNIQVLDANNTVVPLSSPLTSTDTSVVVPYSELDDGTYTCKVQPVCDGTRGDWSELSEPFTKEACPKPTNLHVAWNFNNTDSVYTATLTWNSTNAANDRGFEVGYKLHDAFTWNTTTVTATTYTTPVLDDNVAYDFRVKKLCAGTEESNYVEKDTMVPCANPIVFPEEDKTLGSGTTVSSYLPTYPFYNYSLTQQIYTSDELRINGPISSVSFFNAGSEKTRTLAVYMLHTTKSAFTGSYDWVSVSQDNLVFNGSVTLVANNWTTINFDNSFNYNGTDNLLLVVDDNTGSYQSGFNGRVYDAVGNQAIRIYSDGTNYNPENPSSYYGTTMNVKNQVKFHVGGTFCTPTVSCPAPSNIEVANVEMESATISWKRGGTETDWTVVYTLAGEEHTITVQDTAYTITGLEGSTSYTVTVSVFANCDATHQSTGVSKTLNFKTSCAAFTVPFTESFETTSTSIDCWTVIDNNNDGDMWQINTSSSYVHSGSRSMKIYTDYNYGANDDYLITPPIALTSPSILTYYYLVHSAGEPNDFEVLLSTTGNTPSSFTHVLVPNTEYSNTSFLQSQEISLAQFTGSTVYIAFHVPNGGLDGWNLYLDDITVDLAPACAVPATTPGYNPNTNTLSWTSEAPAFTLQYRESGTEEFTTVTVNDTFYVFTSLESNTTYEYKIQANCGAGDDSRWTDIKTFTTPCGAYDMPFVEIFDDYQTSPTLSCWKSYDLDQDGNTWSLLNYDGNIIMGSRSWDYYEDLDLSADNFLITPKVNITSPNAILSFKIGSIDENWLDGYAVYLDTTGNLDNLIILESYHKAPFGLNEYTYDLSAYYGKTVSVLFRHNDEGQNLLMLDDVSIIVPPACAAPIALSYDVDADTLSWTPSNVGIGTPESYNIRYRLEGDTVWMTATVDTTFYRFGNTLLSASTYEVQVQANCGGGDLSEWSGMITFVAPCGVITTFPWTEDFEEYASGNFIAPCWENEHTVSVSSRTDIFIVYTSENAGNSTHQLQLPDMQIGNMTQLTLPAMIIPDSNYQFVLDVYRSNSTYNEFNIYEGVRVYVSTNGEIEGATEITFVPRQYNTQSTLIPAETAVGWYTYELPLRVSGPCYIILRGESQYCTSTYMDNFKVERIPTCYTPNTIAVSNVTYNGAQITWTDKRNQGHYAVEYMAEGDTAWTTVAVDSTLTVTLANLQYSTNYTARVKTVCGEGDESEYTDEVSFNTPCLGGGYNVAGTSTTGYSSNSCTPFYKYDSKSYAEMLYTANEINQNGVINSIAFDCATPGEYTIDTLRIYMATTTKTSLTTGINNWMPMEEMTLVYEDTNVTVGTAQGWETYALNTPFMYNGENNLLVAVSKSGTTYNSSLYYHATYNSSARVHYQSSVSMPNAGGSLNYYRSNAKFMICPPDNDLAVDSIAPITDACDLSNAKVTIRVKNNSYLNAVNGFTATLALNDTADVVTETVNATIAPQDSYTFTFAHVPAYTDGSNNIKVTVTAAEDEVADNNVITLEDIRQVVPATVPYDQDFSNVDLTRDAWKQGTENNNPNLWKNNNGVLTFMDNDTIDAQNYVITHCIEIPAGQMQVSYDYNAISNMPEGLNVYMGTTPDIASMTLIGSDSNFTKADEDYTFNYLFNNENAGVYYFAIEARSTKGNMGVTFDNLKIMPIIDVMVSIRPDAHGEDNGIVRPHVGINPVPYNGSLTINMIPNEMYHVAGVWVDSVQVVNEDPYNASFMMYTLDNITEAHTIEVQYKMEFHIFKYVYNYNDLYTEAGGQIVGKPIDTTIIPSGGLVQFTADEHYTLYSMVMGNQPPASEGAIIDGENVTVDVDYDEATRTYTYIIDTMYVSNYYVQACFKRDTVAINYATLTGEGVYDGVNTHAGETHITYVDYGTDFTSSILPAEGYYTMNVTVNGVDTGIIDHYDFDSVITEQYVTAQFGHKVTASIMNINNNEYLGSDEVRGGIDPAEQMILSGSSCSVYGYVQEHFHLSNFFVNGVDKLADVTFDGLNFSYTIDSLVANTDIVAVVRIDTIAIYYTVDGGNGYVNGNLMEAPAIDTLYLDYGSSFMSNFAAATGYHIVNVTVNGTAYNEIPQWLTEYLTEAQYITVTFALNEYDITTTAHGNGSVSDGVHVVFDPESSYTFTATPAVGSHISQILRNNEALEISDPEATYTETIAPVLSDYNYVAFFAANVYTVTASCGENGTIDPYGAQSFEYGETPTFTVTPNAGYAIEHVYVDGEEVELTNNAYTFEALTANHTISATFTADNYTITATAGNHGSIDPDGENVVMAGSTVVYTITPATGYEIEDVTVDGQSVGAVSTYTFENVAANHTIAATFSALQFTITATAGANGTITPAGVQTVNYGATPTFTVAANPGYEIDYVLVDGQNVALTNGAYTFAAVTANHEIFAAFKMKTYTITVTDPANGTITPNGTITVNHGATPTFTVTPATGYNVTAITVNGTNVIASAQATVMGAYTYTFPAVTANRTLTATMTKKQFTITATAGAHGTIIGPATVNYGDNATYTIAAIEGYEIEDVTVDGMHVGAVATYTFHNVTANHTIHATFKVEPCVVPTNLRTINIDSTSATLVWYHPGADSYDIQYKVSTANTWTVVSNVPGFAYGLTNLQAATNYVWKIKANTVGCTDNDWSNANSFTTLAGPSSPDGINDYVKNHVNVYAEHNRVHIINDYNVDINNVAIYDMYGKLIYSGNAISNPEVIELNVAVGTYVVRLNTQQGPAVYKVHINR